MTKYTVTWHKLAQDQLAQMWLESSDRRSVSAAANSVDIQLANDAHNKGVPLESDLRFLLSSPLVVLFAVSEPDRLVKVLHVTMLK